MPPIYIIEDDPAMAKCLALAAHSAVANTDLETFPDALSAMSAISERLPSLILLDILLSGPDGFTLLNELISYSDTARVPVIIISSLDLAAEDLSHYGVVASLSKETMTPASLAATIRTALQKTAAKATENLAAKAVEATEV